ncbi:MAG TPA: DUF1636 domain-containing protein [Leptolyngbyaceae cyanobacterium M65_K2018_010]|nr:DUF1636 domain-containing protein [Leptolyngbyaceae cyanobacterium M65_K2018_010]
MPQTTLFVCSLCRFSPTEASRNGLSGGEFLIQTLQAELQARDLEHSVNLTPLRCMAGCSQPCNVSFAAPGKLTFILSQVPATGTALALAEFCQQYTDSLDGRVPYRDRPALVQTTTAFVLPPLPTQG